MRYGAHLKERTFVAKLSHDRIACFQRDAPLDAGRRLASNCTESQIVVRNRTALPQKHRNDSRHDLDIGFLIDRDPGARMDCRKTNTSSGNRRKSIAAYSDCRCLSCRPGSKTHLGFWMTGNPYPTRRWPFGRLTEGLPTIRKSSDEKRVSED